MHARARILLAGVVCGLETPCHPGVRACYIHTRSRDRMQASTGVLAGPSHQDHTYHQVRARGTMRSTGRRQASMRQVCTGRSRARARYVRVGTWQIDCRTGGARLAGRPGLPHFFHHTRTHERRSTVPLRHQPAAQAGRIEYAWGVWTMHIIVAWRCLIKWGRFGVNGGLSGMGTDH